jgi:hypothetical protein
MNDGKLLTLITARRRDDAVMLSRTELVPAVGGQGKIPTDGQLISPLVVMSSPH